jgi:hypothetical protein
MRTLAVTTAAALVAALPAAAQTAPGDGAAAGWYAPGPGDRLFSGVAGLPVYAPENGAATAEAEGTAVALADLEGHALVGHVTDIVIGGENDARAGRGVVVALERHAEALPGEVDTAPEEVVAEAPGEDAPPAVVAYAVETAVAIDRIRFLHDRAAPDLGFALVSLEVQALAEAPLVERRRTAAAPGEAPATDEATPGAAPATDARPEDMPGWQPARARMTAPQITLEGYAPVPAGEIAISELEGAAVFGEAREHLGNIGRIHLDAAGRISHVTVDVGGFLGIGSREVEIGFDEMTVLRDEGRDVVEAQVDATRGTIEAMPEAGAEG